jgi:methyl-accepting chemotaxis protein
MKLSVRARIVLVMCVVVGVNVLAGGLSTMLYAKATERGAVARSAADRARKAAIASQRATEFLGGATDLALAVSRPTVSEEKSRLYGELIGDDQIMSSTLQSLGSALPDTASAKMNAEWRTVQLGVYAWVNGEAQAGGTGLRIARDSAGRFRASDRSNLSTPTALAGLNGAALRTAVRNQTERFKFATLGQIVRTADSDARLSASAEAQARASAQLGTVVLALVNALVAVLLGLWLYRSIARPLVAAREYADRVAHGEYDAKLTRHSDDEIGVLTDAVQKMKDKLVREMSAMREMAGAVLYTADTVITAAEQTAVLMDAPETNDADVRAGLAEVAARAGALTELSGQMLSH